MESHGDGGWEKLPAQTYFPVTEHSTHGPNIPEAKKIELIAKGKGLSGTAYDYLVLLVAELTAMGIHDATVEAMLPQVESFRARIPPKAEL